MPYKNEKVKNNKFQFQTSKRVRLKFIENLIIKVRCQNVK